MDLVSVVSAAVCHDFGHDGFTNAYHVNSISDRAITYSDQSVQENYHVSESFKILNQDQYNYLSTLSRNEYKTFRKRFIGIILATDMARHVADLARFKSIVEKNEIKQGENAKNLIDKSNPTKEFDSK